MKRIISFAALIGIVLTSCTHNFKPKEAKLDTVVVAYKQVGVGWRLNMAIREQKMGRKFLNDSTLSATLDYITTFRLAVPPIKTDSIIDSTTHKLLRINMRYDVPLPDTLSHYLSVLDSTNTITP